MNFNLSWIFSIFKVPKFSRAVSCDARNIRLRYLRHLWNLKASCYYGRNVRSGCDDTFSIPDLKTEALPSTSASIVKAGLNNVWRTKSKAASQHEQGIIRPPNLETSRAFSCVPVTLFDFLPNTVSPSQSLLFLPPSPLPKRDFNIGPFSPEEDTVPLPPAYEPKSTTYPIRSPDHEFPINTLPSPSLPTDHTVPCSPLFPTQSSNILSPLSIALSFPPLAAPLPQELIIKITGPEGYFNANHHKSQITDFLSSRAEVVNSLVVIWQLSHTDSGGGRGFRSLKALFTQLNEKVLDSDRTALSGFSKLSITIPDLVEAVKEDDIIDLANATDLLEFAWHGDFVIFASKIKNLSFVTLTCLNIKSSIISMEDAITVLYSCSGLQTVSLGTIRSDAIMSMKSSGVERKRRKALPNLIYLALESDVALHPLIQRFCWTTHVSLSLTLRKQGTASLVQALDSGLQEQRCPYLAQLLTPGS